MREEGLRERKKRETREAIAAAARRLFLERGFDGVTVAEVARAADVSPATVFNYFPTKEDIFFSGMRAFEAQLVEAVRKRGSGVSALAAFRQQLIQNVTRLAQPRTADMIASAARVISATPALQARERAVVAEHTTMLADVLATEAAGAGSHVEVRVVANALMGVHIALLEDVRARVLGGERGTRLAKAYAAEADQACSRLEDGLREYAVRRD